MIGSTTRQRSEQLTANLAFYILLKPAIEAQ